MTEYSLREVAQELGVSTAWINKIQKHGIMNKIDTKGKRVSFSKKDIGVFRRVKLLRKLDYSLQHIKEIYEIEKNIINCPESEYSEGILDASKELIRRLSVLKRDVDDYYNQLKKSIKT